MHITHFSHLVSIAPMMGYTDRFYRYMVRGMGTNALLYTEMVTDNAVIHARDIPQLQFHAIEHPIAAQIGGCQPKQLAIAAKKIQNRGFDAINLNMGCPSQRVAASGKFGAHLMKDKKCAADCIAAIKDAVTIPVTVKCRIGVDQYDKYSMLADLIDTLAEAGIVTFVIHARKAILTGILPADNLKIPPLVPEYVYRIKQEFPDLHVGINGGITSAAQAIDHLRNVDSVMIGRAAYKNPRLLVEIEDTITQRPRIISDCILQGCKALYHIAKEEKKYKKTSLHHIMRPITGLFYQLPYSKKIIKKMISIVEKEYHKMPGVDIFLEAIQFYLSNIDDEAFSPQTNEKLN